MITIDTTGLVKLMADHEPIDLIDVRPPEEFNRAHIRAARSEPLNRFAPVKILRERKAAPTRPFFIIGDRVRAGLAAGMLRGAGCSLPVVVEGGMDNWQTLGLPAVRRRWPIFSGRQCT